MLYLLSPQDAQHPCGFFHPLQIEAAEPITRVYLSLKRASARRALQKLLQRTQKSDALILSPQLHDTPLADLAQPAPKSPELLEERMEEVLAHVCKRWGYTLPLHELIIMTEPPRACALIERLRDAAHVFTIVSPVAATDELDALFARYGIIVRQVPTLFSRLGGDTVIVAGDMAECVAQSMECPIISLCADPPHGARVVSVDSVLFTPPAPLVWERLGCDAVALLRESLPDAPFPLRTTAGNAAHIFLLDRTRI